MKTVIQYAKPGYVRQQMILVALEQATGAFATAALALAAQNISNPSALLTYVISFMFFWILGPWFHIWSRKSEYQGYVDLYESYLEKNLFAQSGRTRAWANRQQRESFLTAIGAEGETYISCSAGVRIDMMAYIMSIVFNAIALAFVVDSDFSWIFAVSLIVGFGVYRIRRDTIQALVNVEQKNRLALVAYILKSWDNVLIKNSVVINRYQTKTKSILEATRSASGVSTQYSFSTIFLITTAASIPVFVLNLYLAYQNQNDPAFLATLMVTLPRQVTLLVSLKALFNQMTNKEIFDVRLNTAEAGVKLHDATLEDRMDLSKVKIDSEEAQANLIEKIKAISTGRKVITGPNGAGKSSLLLLLNEQLPNSIYLPAAADLEIGQDTANASTGERMLKHLEFVATTEVGVLLLDEWDANLDTINTQKIEERLDQISKTKLIIEVRH